jgi:hypothetical protein
VYLLQQRAVAHWREDMLAASLRNCVHYQHGTQRAATRVAAINAQFAHGRNQASRRQLPGAEQCHRDACVSTCTLITNPSARRLRFCAVAANASPAQSTSSSGTGGGKTLSPAGHSSPPPVSTTGSSNAGVTAVVLDTHGMPLTYQAPPGAQPPAVLAGGASAQAAPPTTAVGTPTAATPVLPTGEHSNGRSLPSASVPPAQLATVPHSVCADLMHYGLHEPHVCSAAPRWDAAFMCMSHAAASYWELLNNPEQEATIFGNRARSATDANVLRRKGHLKEQVLLCQWLGMQNFAWPCLWASSELNGSHSMTNLMPLILGFHR